MSVCVGAGAEGAGQLVQGEQPHPGHGQGGGQQALQAQPASTRRVPHAR